MSTEQEVARWWSQFQTYVSVGSLSVYPSSHSVVYPCCVCACIYRQYWGITLMSTEQEVARWWSQFQTYVSVSCFNTSFYFSQCCAPLLCMCMCRQYWCFLFVCTCTCTISWAWSHQKLQTSFVDSGALTVFSKVELQSVGIQLN